MKTALVCLIAAFLLAGCDGTLPERSGGRASVRVAGPDSSFRFSVASYPDMAVVPGYPVYYAPDLDANYFSYGGAFWLFLDDNWYTSAGYNGPWRPVDPIAVPDYVLRVPVRYYRHPPADFRGWQHDEPPRWSERWGHDWERQRPGWDGRDHRAVPAPQPTYSRPYQEDRNPPRAEPPRRYEPPSAQPASPWSRQSEPENRYRPQPGPTPPVPEQRRPGYEPQRPSAPTLQERVDAVGRGNPPFHNTEPQGMVTPPKFGAPSVKPGQESAGRGNRPAPDNAQPWNRGAVQNQDGHGHGQDKHEDQDAKHRGVGPDGKPGHDDKDRNHGWNGDRDD